jgi:uncharacterized protein (DUF427 family)
MKNSLGEAIDPNHTVTVDDVSVRLQVVIGGEVIADTERALLVRETGLPPRYYIPPADVRLELLARTGHQGHCPYKGDWAHLSARVAESELANVAWTYFRVLQECPRIHDHVAFYPDRVDAFLIDGVPVARR